MIQSMIAILDLGSTENARIAREIRALGVYSEIFAHDVAPEALKAAPGVCGVILNGGENRVVDGVAIDVNPAIFDLGLPVLAAGAFTVMYGILYACRKVRARKQPV